LDGRDAQEQAVRALKCSGLPAHLLRKALLVVGVPWKDICNLNGKEAEALLNQRLVQLVMRKAAASLISGTIYSLLSACFRGWKLLKGNSNIAGIRDLAEDPSDSLDCGKVFEGLQEESRRRDKAIVQLYRPPELVDEEENPEYWKNDAGLDGPCTPSDAPVSPKFAPVSQSDGNVTETSPAEQEAAMASVENSNEGENPSERKRQKKEKKDARDRKAKAPKGQLSEDVEGGADLRQVASDQDARSRKFENLDTELAQWLDDFAESSASPLASRM
jgi:hypothetical protein